MKIIKRGNLHTTADPGAIPQEVKCDLCGTIFEATRNEDRVDRVPNQPGGAWTVQCPVCGVRKYVPPPPSKTMSWIRSLIWWA